MNWTWFHKLASPPYVYRVAAACAPWLYGLAVITIGYGVVAGLFLGFATDYVLVAAGA
jgi:heme exporter protein C